jgi:Uncharacterized conserved protein
MVSQVKVAVHGSYFADNYGDTLLVKLMCDMAAEVVGRENVYLAVPGHPREQQSIGYPVLSASERHTVTHLIYGGGGYLGERTGKFWDSLSWSVRNYRRHLSWRSQFSLAKSAVVGTGFGPISNRLLRIQVRRLLNDASVVLLRDQESLSFAREYGIEHPNMDRCVDIALSLPLRSGTREGIAIHIDNLSDSELQLVLGTLVSIHGLNAHIEAVFDNPASQTPAAIAKYQSAAKSAGLTNFSVHKYINFEELVDRVSHYALIITSKLHVGITCIAQGGCVISIPTHQKTIRLYRQLGIPDFCIPRDGLTQERLRHAVLSTEKFLPDREVISDGMKKVRDAVVSFLRS